MTSTRRPRPLAIAGGWVALMALLGTPGSAPAGDDPPPLALKAPGAEARVAVPPRSGRKSAGEASSSSGGWWLGTAGVAAALAAFGGLSLASRKFRPGGDSGPIRVVGRAGLSGKHAVYLVRVGDRVLIVGAGPQGAPSSLGEVTDPAELARLIPGRAASPRFDRRIGGDE